MDQQLSYDPDILRQNIPAHKNLYQEDATADGAEDEENATEHQEITVKTLGYTEHNAAESQHHISNVYPAQAGVSLIPLDDFSSVDTEANNLAHMVCSKGEGLSLTQERVDQELPYQEATPTLEATTWSVLVAMLGTLALTLGGGKKIIYLLTILLSFLGSGGLHSHSSIYREHHREPNYLKHVRVRLKTEEDVHKDVHNVDEPEVPPDPGSSPQPWMKYVAELHHLRRVQVRIRPDDKGNVHEVQIPKVSPHPGPLHELGGS